MIMLVLMVTCFLSALDLTALSTACEWLRALQQGNTDCRPLTIWSSRFLSTNYRRGPWR